MSIIVGWIFGKKFNKKVKTLQEMKTNLLRSKTILRASLYQIFCDFTFHLPLTSHAALMFFKLMVLWFFVIFFGKNVCVAV